MGLLCELWQESMRRFLRMEPVALNKAVVMQLGSVDLAVPPGADANGKYAFMYAYGTLIVGNLSPVCPARWLYSMHGARKSFS